MYVVKSPLSDADLKTVSEALPGALVDLVDLALVAKQIHWNVVGPRFRSVISSSTNSSTPRGPTPTPWPSAPPLSGVSPDGRAATVAVGSGIGVTPRVGRRHHRRAARMVDALGAVIGRMRERVKSTGEPDPVSQDIFIRITADLEKHHWMF